jgi:histidinol-phosphatase (PHP family)
MTRTSLHTHTSFCDGTDDVETMCRAAWKKGLAAVGFSGHAPISRKIGFTTGWHIPEERLEEYLAQVRAARRRWEGKLRVFLGLEVDYIKGLCGPADRDIRELGLDYIIASVHYLLPPGNGPLFSVDGPMEELARGVREGFAGDGEAMMAAYWDAVQDMIAAGGFDILGHADLIKKNNAHRRWFNPEAGTYGGKIRETARAAGKAALVAELNTGGLTRNRCPDTYPSVPLLRLFREAGVPVIITADAHRAGELDGHYQNARENLAAAGYTEHALFGGREANGPRWIFEPL